MPNLVGIGNTQVPTNAMLGGLAYRDSVGEIDIDKIKAKIPTPLQVLDIFVYDTRKDSDGGAWRHRTENTSWYNEAVSATRGARKEFPAVAVIVIENGGTYEDVIKIYDGDDPNLPMWMVFKSRNASGGSDQTTAVNYYAAGPYPIRKVVMLNGMMVDCQYRSSGHVANIVKGVTRYNFINDSSIMITDEGEFKRNGNLGDERNTERSYQKISTTEITHTQCNGLAITVLPNAPIDASTGLPVPTIVVGTDGGTNIINNDGTVTLYTNIATKDVDIHPDGFMIDGVTGATNDNFSFFKIGNTTRLTAYDARAGVTAYNTYFNNATGECLFEGKSNKLAISQTLGLLRIEEEFSDYASGLHNRTGSSYNTGWMHGDIKGAFLSDTDNTNVTGETIDLTNGQAVTGQAGNFSSISANSLVAGTIASGSLGRYDTGTDGSVLVAGKQYLATLTISNYNGSGDLGVASGAGFDSNFRYSANGTYYTYITYNSGEVQIFYRNTNTATIGLSLKEVDIDRSVNNKGLAIYGTVAKSAVATGAELVAYSGFNSSNYLFQPHNTDLEFGTGDYSVMLWYKGHSNSTGNREIFANLRGSSNHWVLSKEYTNKFVFDTVTDPSTYSENIWYHVAGVRRSGTAKLYVNGELVGSAAANDNINDTSDGLIVGQSPDNNDWRTRGSLALLRISGSTPTDEQIKKIYNDEKCLYHENAKCTLHGTSDDVKSIAYDDKTDVLHVGTSGGRSDFRGLNRINNTTTAVTTAISASNEFVAEQ